MSAGPCICKHLGPCTCREGSAEHVTTGGPCPTCGGDREIFVGVERDFDTGMFEADDSVPCPDCCGHEPVIPVAELREFIEDARAATSPGSFVGQTRAVVLNALVRLLDEHERER